MHSPESPDRCCALRQQQLPHIHGSIGNIHRIIGHERCASSYTCACAVHHGQYRLHQKTDTLLLFFRLLTFCCALASLLLMLTAYFSTSSRLTWLDFDAYRYVSAASAIVCVYSLAEIGMTLWYLFKGRPLMPELISYWFDFGHDQGFTYLIFSACSAATAVAQNLREGNLLVHDMRSCHGNESFCARVEISLGFAFGASSFIALSALISGYRLSKWLLIGL